MRTTSPVKKESSAWSALIWSNCQRGTALYCRHWEPCNEVMPQSPAKGYFSYSLVPRLQLKVTFDVFWQFFKCIFKFLHEGSSLLTMTQNTKPMFIEFQSSY